MITAVVAHHASEVLALLALLADRDDVQLALHGPHRRHLVPGHRLEVQFLLAGHRLAAQHHRAHLVGLLRRVGPAHLAPHLLRHLLAAPS